MRTQSSPEFRRQLVDGYGLTLVTIWYTKPGHPTIINPYPFVWQYEDQFPKFPRLLKMLNEWPEKNDSQPVGVFIAHNDLVGPTELRAVDGEFRLH